MLAKNCITSMVVRGEDSELQIGTVFIKNIEIFIEWLVVSSFETINFRFRISPTIAHEM
jgi:hypothetical protein